VDKVIEQAKAGAAGTEQPPAYNPAMGYLRGFVVFFVVVHHSVLAYMPGIPAPKQFSGGLMLWRAFPVLDPASWALTPLIASFNDSFFMALIFLLSGLFVTGSVGRKGLGHFLRDRVLRLGIGFLFSALIIVPIAYYTAYLQTGAEPGFANYWHAWNAIGYWPTGPAWFVLLLLVYDFVVAGLFWIAPGWTNWVSRIASGARQHPVRFFFIILAVSFVAYPVLAIPFGPRGWTYWGLFQFQTSRILHHFVYFVLGIGIGAVGLESGLVASDGKLGRRWWAWVLTAIVVFLLGTMFYFAILAAKGPRQQLLIDLGSISFALTCAALSFAFLAIFSRFARQPNRIWRSLADNSYGIYLVHYAFVAWCQYALLTAPLPGAVKAVSVIAAALVLSWGTTALLRRIALVARVV
jgi:peptidoglycan/LPS O-acetylase OafA/YrhL